MIAFVHALASFPRAAATTCASCADVSDASPDLAAVPARLRRGLGAHSKMVLDTLLAVVPEPLRASVPIVHGSAYGELETAVFLATTSEPAPARFTTSVHSAVVGVYSVAFGNRRGHTTISAGDDTLATCLVDALGRLAEGERFVAVVVADETSERLHEPGDTAFALAFLLGREPRDDARAVRVELGLAPDESAPRLHSKTRAFEHAIRCRPGRSHVPPSRAGEASIVVEGMEEAR